MATYTRTLSGASSAPPIVLPPEVEEAIYSATYLEDFMDACENLPPTVQTRISQIHELNIVQGKYLRKIQTLSDTLLKLIGDVQEQDSDSGKDAEPGNGGSGASVSLAGPTAEDCEDFPPIEYIDLEPDDFDDSHTRTLHETVLGRIVDTIGGAVGYITSSAIKATINGGEISPPIEFIDLEPDDFDEAQLMQSITTLAEVALDTTDAVVNYVGGNATISTPKTAVDGDGITTISPPIELIDLEPASKDENEDDEGDEADDGSTNPITISSNPEFNAIYAELERLLVLNQELSDEKGKLVDSIKEIVAFKLEQLDIDKSNLDVGTT